MKLRALKRSGSVFVMVCLVIAFPTSSFASTFTWLDDFWNVALLPIVTSGMGPAPGQQAGQAARAFGASATGNGQVLNADADVALARSESVVLAPNAEATTSVQFERSFELDGSPGGWVVSLLGLLSGSLVLNDPTGIAEAAVLPKAALFDEDDALIVSIGESQSRDEDGGIGFSIPYSDKVLLADGIYTIEGSLKTIAVTLPGNGPAQAKSLFFDGGWAVGVQANPVPEPSTLLLFATGLAGIAGIRRARLRRPVAPRTERQDNTEGRRYLC